MYHKVTFRGNLSGGYIALPARLRRGGGGGHVVKLQAIATNQRVRASR